MSIFRKKTKTIQVGHPVVGNPSKQIKADKKKLHREGALGMIILAFALIGAWYLGRLLYLTIVS